MCSARRLSSGLRQWQFARFNTFESVPENNSESEHVNVSAQTEGCLNVTWSFPIILKRECFHNNMSRLKWLKLSTLLIFKMVSKCCFIYVSYIFVSVSPFERQIYTIDSCWYRQLIPLTHAQNAHVSLPSAVDFWSDAADARRQHRRLSSPLTLWSWLGVSRPLRIWNDMRVSMKWQNCHFWVNYPFK